MTMRPLRIGTRGSKLARRQADWVASELARRGVDCEQVLIDTRGDKQQDWSIAALGSTGVFTKEIQHALLAGEVDLAVHSLKDLPTEPVPGLTLAAVPARAPCGDVLVSRGNVRFEQLPTGAKVGTGSRRRHAQLAAARDDLEIVSVRGNVDTRLAKLDAGEFDAIVLAEAGLVRLEHADRITQRLSPAYLLPAVGQGALGLETRVDDAFAQSRAALLDDAATHAAVRAERAFLAALRAGCLAPVAAWGRFYRGWLLLTGRVLSLDGRMKCEATCSGNPAEPEELGRRTAGILLAQGAGDLIAAAHE
ncbi:hydroxymethylbilane synthase [Thermostilla marina]